MSLRPITTACLPCIAMHSRSRHSIHPSGVQDGHPSGRFLHQQADVIGVKPVHILRRTMASNTRCSTSAPIPSGNGDCTRMPSIVSSELSRCPGPAPGQESQRRPAGRARPGTRASPNSLDFIAERRLPRRGAVPQGLHPARGAPVALPEKSVIRRRRASSRMRAAHATPSIVGLCFFSLGFVRPIPTANRDRHGKESQAEGVGSSP